MMSDPNEYCSSQVPLEFPAQKEHEKGTIASRGHPFDEFLHPPKN